MARYIPRKEQKKKPWKDREHKFDLTIREGHTPMIVAKDKTFKEINEILEMLNKKL